MTKSRTDIPAKTTTRDRTVALTCVGVVAAMLGMSYAAVPLYQIFCQVTGYAGTTQVAVKPSDNVVDKLLTMRFDANVSSKLGGWDFKAKQSKFDVRYGENALAYYTATNTSDRPITATATFNVTPEVAGVYFNKIECFCFTEQTLAPGESVEMPVSFYVDPQMLQDKDADHIKQLTLSYTFFPVEGQEEKSARLRASVEKKRLTQSQATATGIVTLPLGREKGT